MVVAVARFAHEMLVCLDWFPFLLLVARTASVTLWPARVVLTVAQQFVRIFGVGLVTTLCVTITQATTPD